MQDNEALLGRLVAADVQFVVIGGVAANAHGSMTASLYLDIAAPLTIANCERLPRALAGLTPRFAHRVPPLALAHTAEELATFRNVYLLTDLGQLDVLGTVPAIGDFAAVAQAALTIVAWQLPLKIMSLDQLIAVKQATGRPKDQWVALELAAIRDKIGPKPQTSGG